MKNVTIALAAVLGVAFVVPTIQTAQAETVKKVIIKRGHDRGHHYGWRNHHHAKKVVVIKHRSHHM